MNSAAYDAALRQRGSLTIWFTEKAVAAWKAEPAHDGGRAALVLRYYVASATTAL